MSACARCGHEIDPGGEDGGGGITRAWDGAEDGYRDYHGLCRDLTLNERRGPVGERARRPARPAAATPEV